jgi:hypothetical protein
MELRRRAERNGEGPRQDRGPVVAEGRRERVQPERRREPVESTRRQSAAGSEGVEPARRRRTFAWRTRDAGAAAVGTAGAGVVLLARLVMAVASLIALLIGLAIVLRDVDANGANTIVKGIHEGANFFAGAFTGLIRFNGHPKRAITVDWGIALLVYLIVGAIVSNLIAGVGRGGVRFERTHRAAPTA